MLIRLRLLMCCRVLNMLRLRWTERGRRVLLLLLEL